MLEASKRLFMPSRLSIFRQPFSGANLLGVVAMSCAAWACGGEDSSPGGNGEGGDSHTGGQGAVGGSATGGQNGSSTGGQNGGSATGGQNGGDSPPLPDNDTTPAPERDGFTLLFEDHFDSLDTTRWQTASHTFTENAAQFDPSMVTIEDGYLRLGLQAAETPSAEGREYIGGELRTLDFFSYGRFEARIRFASGSGVISSLFTFYDHYADPNLPENWNEIDIEFLGKDSSRVQFNVIHWNASDQRTTHEKFVTTDYNPSQEFHDYAIEWLPTEVRFYIDEQLVHTQVEQVEEFLNLDSRLMMNIWPVQNTPNLTAWAGEFTAESVPTAAYYDWVRVYAYTP